MGWRARHWTLWYWVFVQSFWGLVLVYRLCLRYLYVKPNKLVSRQSYEVHDMISLTQF